MKELFEISEETMKQLLDIKSSLKCDESEIANAGNNSCTCCWGGWCANGCSG